ncbi:WD40 repeat domain-containing protein [Streptomyces sp. NBC_00287]|uniref:WD40 repeat domain-containing protein n=1 Tax=Streptomyces sp. NBC_00287 TaxID=2975702 RepID=UPI002E29BCB1|nr:WD40 repeat domain-containing protein [Streptomyces sp. NBC_00287]
MTDDGRFVLVGVGDYQDASWPRLRHVPASVDRLYKLFRSLGLGHDLPELAAGGDWAWITERLRAWQGDGSRLVLYWTGHGCVDAGEHFLIASDSPGTRLDDLRAITARNLARFLAHREFSEVLVLLDCCASGVAASRVATQICQVLNHTSTAGPERRYAVIASTRGYDSAEEGVFAEALEQVVRHGPEDRRWTEHDETIRSDELADVMGRIMADRDGATAYVALGAPVPALRNPLHPSATVPDEDVETKRLRRLRAAEVDQHLVLSARGIEVGETGWYFCGRQRLMRRLIGWLAEADRGLFVVTGSPGTGKSALLGRIATLSVPGLRAVAEAEGALNDTPNSELPPLGSVDLALSCRNKTLDDCLRAVAVALGLPGGTGWLRAAEVVRQVGELGRRVTVVIDGLDEAKPAEAVPIAADLLRPLAELPGVRVLVGTRPHRAGGTSVSPDAGPLLQALAADETAVLDEEPETEADLTAYALRRLLGAEHSPLRGRETLARRWAERVADASGGIFLYARIATRAVLDEFARSGVMGRDLQLERLLSSGLPAVLDEEFGRSPDPERLRDLLRPLAWAEGAGLPRRDLWPVLAGALSADGRRYRDEDVAWVLEHAGFHVVESGESGQTVYRLYHQALIDHFRDTSPQDAHARITRALRATLPGRGPAAWETAHPYLRRHLAAHALAAGLLPEMMRDLGFLTCADPARTAAAVRSLPDRFALPVARLYLRTAHRLPPLTPHERLRTLQMTATFEEPSLSALFRGHAVVPATLEAASAPSDDFSVVLRGHAGPVVALEAVDTGDGRELLASAGGDATVRLWEPDTGETRMVLTGPDTTVTALTRLTDAEGHRLLVAAAGRDLYVWDLGTGAQVRVLRGHTDTVLSLTAVHDATSPLLVSAGEDRTLRLWRPHDWSVTVLTGHLSPVTAVTSGRLPDGRHVLLSTGADCTVRRWHVDGPEAAGVMHGHTGTVYALACLEPADDQTLAVSGGDDGTVRVWDVGRSALVRVIPGRVRGVRSLAPFRAVGRTFVAAAGTGSRITVVEPSTGSLKHSLKNRVAATADQFVSRGVTSRQVVASSLPRDTQPLAEGGSYALAPLATGSRAGLFASAGWDGTVRLWDAQLGGRPDQPDYDGLRARCIAALPHPADGVPWALAVAGRDGGVWLTDARGERRTELWPAHRKVRMLTAVTPPDGHPIVALVEEEHKQVRFVDVGTGREFGAPEGLIPPVLSVDRVSSLHVYSAAGRVAALVVHYEVAGPRSVVWLPGSRPRVRRHDDSARIAVPFEGQTVVMNSEGLIEVHGDSVDDVRVVAQSRRKRSPLPPVTVRTPTGDGQFAFLVRTKQQDAIKIMDLGPVGVTTDPRSLRHSGVPITHWTRLERPDQDLIVAACEDDTLRVWNPTRPDREPLTVPLPGAATDVSAVAPDLVYVLVDEHWLALRLRALGPLLSA